MNFENEPSVASAFDGKPPLHQALLVPVTPACQVLGVGRTKLYELVAGGHLSLVKIGSKSLITVESLQRFVAGLSPAAPTTER